jgi:hypothetical protein
MAARIIADAHHTPEKTHSSHRGACRFSVDPLFRAACNFSVRVRILRTVALFILLAMLGGQLSDVFDKPDRSPRVKSDPDYMLVVAAACVGFAFLVAKRVLASSRHPLAKTRESRAESSPAMFFALVRETNVAGPSPPSVSPLRI